MSPQHSVVSCLRELRMKRDDPTSFEARSLRRRITDMKAAQSPWTMEPALAQWSDTRGTSAVAPVTVPRPPSGKLGLHGCRREQRGLGGD